MRMLKYLVFVCVLSLYFVSCDDDSSSNSVTQTDDDDKADDTTDDFDGPDYPDNYLAYASWSLRTKWNLGNVHDPSVAKCGDYYYMYQTDASYGNVHEGHGYFPYRRSENLVDWYFQGMTFDEIPAWVKDSLNAKRERGGLTAISSPSYACWAPCIRKVNDNLYRLYYSIVVTDAIDASADYSWTERAFIGLAETSDLGSNVWEDKGMVICSEPDGQETYIRSSSSDYNAYFQFNAIDPSFIITPEGDHWLIYGSWHCGIAAVQLDPETGKPYQLETLSDYGQRIAGRGTVSTDRWQALEGAEIIYNDQTGYYYLFVAYDELLVAYNTRVSRSKSITGPYLGYNGGNVTNGAECYPILTHPYMFSDDEHEGWVGFSHCAVFHDDEGQWYYASQARFPEGISGITASNAIMLGHVRKIEWTSDGWPVVSPERFAGVPQEVLVDSLITGTYEIVELNYEYQVVQEPSSTLYLSSKHKVGGDYSGEWSFDSVTGILTVGSQEFIVRNGYDWEASPRKTTIVISGINSSGSSLWGKKSL